MTDFERDIEMEEIDEEASEAEGTLSGRIEAILFVAGEPVRIEELAKALNLNLGTLCRDMNSLYECKLLILESGNERRRYRTNRETMAYLAAQARDGRRTQRGQSLRAPRHPTGRAQRAGLHG